MDLPGDASEQTARIKKMNGEDRRRQILEVTLHLFSEEGYYAATTAKIAEAAGITEPTLYRYFTNKKELFLAILDDSSKHIGNALSSVIQRCKHPSEIFSFVLDVNFDHVTPVDIERHKVWFMAIAINDPEIRDAVRRYDKQSMDLLTSSIEQAIAAGEIRSDFRPEILARIMISLWVEWMITVILEIDEKNKAIFNGEKELIEDVLQKAAALE